MLAIARGLMLDPKTLLLDEPTVANVLDVRQIVQVGERSRTPFSRKRIVRRRRDGLAALAGPVVESIDDLLLLREHLRNKESDIELIAKIEKPEAISGIDSIIAASDALMIARGDLGVEIDVAQVPIIQKDLIRRCQVAGKPVIVATQMLQSMIEQASPTRAEVSDVANAIFDGTDAVMLSGETSVGPGTASSNAYACGSESSLGMCPATSVPAIPPGSRSK